MNYSSLRECVDDLARAGHLRTIDAEVDARLEVAEIQRRLYAAGGPALLLTRVKGCQFPLLLNLFGTMDRARFIFRHTLDPVRKLFELKVDPSAAMRKPWRYAGAPLGALRMLPRRVRNGPVLECQTTISQLPQQVSWPEDGGAFITLPQVYTEDPDHPGMLHSNLGMYRVQLSGGEYQPDREIGLHYQIHRGIGVHHAAALRHSEPLQVNIFVGGPPAMTLSAVMPLPEGISEVSFAGVLGGRRVPMIQREGNLAIHANADFCITGHVIPGKTLPEGPFGDHLGYYSLAHEFPVLAVERVYHRRDAIWPLTVVGRPPQEDTVFGKLIHELTGPVIPAVIPGVHAVNAVDAAGVHPLLLAQGSERYVPYGDRSRPQELLTQAHAILGQGQMSLAKYLLIVSKDDDPSLNIEDIGAFLAHLLSRADFQRDLHFETCTTIDTLDYSGSGFNEGSKLVIAAVGPPRFKLATEISGDVTLPEGFSEPRVCLPGVLAISGPRAEQARSSEAGDPAIAQLCEALRREATNINHPLAAFRWIVVVDDSRFAAATLNNFLWVTFTRSNPAVDVHGMDAFTRHKHWGCRGPLVIDARIKPHHAPPLVEDPAVTRRVDQLAAPGAPLHGIL